jgi:hypothetical protein
LGAGFDSLLWSALPPQAQIRTAIPATNNICFMMMFFGPARLAQDNPRLYALNHKGFAGFYDSYQIFSKLHFSEKPCKFKLLTNKVITILLWPLVPTF